MNYKKIAKFIKDARHLTIWNTCGLQYISNGAAIYPVFGMPRMKEMEMLNFLGLADKSNAISVVMKDAPDWVVNTTYDACDENVLEKTGPMILLQGDTFRTFYTECGAIVVNNSYISVVENGIDKDMPIVHCLTDTGFSQAVAVFVGFELYAIVLPVETKDLYHEYIKLSTQLQLAESSKIFKKMDNLRSTDESEE